MSAEQSPPPGARAFSPPPLAQQAQIALGEGVTITSTGTPGLDGVYDVSAAAQANITATML